MSSTYQLHCAACGHGEVCGLQRMTERVQQLGMLRRAARPEPEMVRELFFGALPRMACRGCQQTGLQASEFVEDLWEDDRRCADCGKLISRARLEVLPEAQHCVECASGT